MFSSFLDKLLPSLENQDGIHSLIIQVSDGTLTTEETFNIIVFEVNSAPVLSPIEDKLISCAELVSLSAHTQDVDYPDNRLTYSLQGYVSESATIDPATGVFSRTPITGLSGRHEFTIRVTDNGEPASYDEERFVLTFEDKESPKTLTQDILIQLGNDGMAFIEPKQIDNGSIDNCLPSYLMKLSIDKSNFSCSDIGQHTVTLTVADSAGNIGTGTSLVTVEDIISPNLIPNQQFTIEENISFGKEIGRVLGTDNCRIAVWEITAGNSMNAITIDANGVITIQNPEALYHEGRSELSLSISVMDKGGNSATETVIIRLSKPTGFFPNKSLNSKILVFPNPTSGTIWIFR